MNYKRYFLTFAAGLILALVSVPVLASGGGAAAEHVEGQPIYVELKPLIVPVFARHSKVEILALNLVIEAKDTEDSHKITENTPKLRDGFIRSLYGRMEADFLIDKNGILDVEMLKKRLMAVADHVMEPGTVSDILLQGVVHQKGR